MNKFLMQYAHKWHPKMNGVIHRRGFKCGTDAHIMVIIKDDYPQEYEGKILDRNGQLHDDGVYFHSGIPEMKRATEISLNYKRFSELFKQYDQEKKNTPKELRPVDYLIQIGDNLFNVNQLKKFIKGARKIGSKNLFVNILGRPIITNDGENLCALMPIRPGYYHEDAFIKVYKY